MLIHLQMQILLHAKSFHFLHGRLNSALLTLIDKSVDSASALQSFCNLLWSARQKPNMKAHIIINVRSCTFSAVPDLAEQGI